MSSLEAFVAIHDFESADLVVNGLTVLERNIKTLIKANIQVVLCGAEDLRNKLKEYCAQFQLTFVNVSEVEQEVNCLYLDGDVQYSLKFIPQALKVIGKNLQCSHKFELPSGGSVPFEWRELDEAQIHVVDERSFSIVRPNELKSLRAMPFAEIYDNAEGWITRSLNKKISFPITRFLLRFPITPNQITVFCFAMGLLGCFLLAWPDYYIRVLGALMIQFNSILDGCDGEVARLKVETSRIGAWMDTISDDVLNNVMFVCIYIGYINQNYSGPLLKFCILTTVASLGMSFFLYHFMITNNDPNASHYKLSWESDAPSQSSQPGIFDRVKPLLKRDFSIFAIMIAIILNVRLVVLISSGLIWIGFILYMVSFFHSFLMSRKAHD